MRDVTAGTEGGHQSLRPAEHDLVVDAFQLSVNPAVPIAPAQYQSPNELAVEAASRNADMPQVPDVLPRMLVWQSAIRVRGHQDRARAQGHPAGRGRLPGDLAPLFARWGTERSGD